MSRADRPVSSSTLLNFTLSALLIGASTTMGCSDETTDELPDPVVDASVVVEDAGGSADTGTGEMDAGSTMEDAGVEDAGSVPTEPTATTIRPESGIFSPALIDLVFVGDGYTVDELESAYVAHVRHVAGRMFNRVRRGSTEPFFSYRTFFNVHRITVASNESGIDEMGQERDTALDATDTCGLDRCYIDTTKLTEVITQATAGTDIVPDVVIVALNTEQPLEDVITNDDGTFIIYGGGAETDPSDDIDFNTSERVLRQLARVMGGAELAESGSGAYAGAEPTAPNLSLLSDGSKWAPWMGFNAGNDDQGAVGSFEGGAGFANGIYRPVDEDKMTGDYPAPYDPVTREAIIVGMFDIVTPLAMQSTPNNETLMNPQFIEAFPMDANLVNVEWYINGMQAMSAGQPIEGGLIGFAAVAAEMGLDRGTYMVEARLSAATRFRFPDRNSGFQDFVRRPSANMSQTITWTVVY